jgi:hypothetical protein
MALPALLAPILAAAAPRLIRLATGSTRAEAVTGAVADAVAEVAGVRPDTPDAAEAARRRLAEDPALTARLAERLRGIEEREFEAALADLADARARDVAIRRLGGGAGRADVMLGMAFLAIVAIAATLVWLMRQDGADPQLVGAIIGFLTGVGGMFARNIGSAFDFEFGSSRGSKAKDAQIESLTRDARALSVEAGRTAAPLNAFRRSLSAD